jgi:hypothetical protein
LEPPVEAPPPDPAQERAESRRRRPAPEARDYHVDVDVRGETLTYREPGREATVICTFGGDPCIAPRTLSGWWYPAEQRSETMAEEERARLIARIAEYCRSRHGMSRLRFEGE